MKQVKINKLAVITEGELIGCMGNVVAYDSSQDEVLIRLDAHTKVIVSSEHIEQD